ncbi:GNAT family N-acetyltransferase [Spirosoma endbachense]|uniref:GNAT family N-acetyltransferase n=1 Tax=Spirosoma endbachense TaxID=2666025 RepID=A0A6P1VYQ8_9BACT|nr:GNAT family N-acetyltransferase [Spirosoma endbachense]QHV96910.1 GNAT family N-acetyltransferase [Spirosoma endbachense]
MDHKLSTIVRRNFIAKATYFARLLPGMHVADTETFTVVDCGLPSDTFNVVIPKTTKFASLADLFENRVSEFSRKRFPLAFWCWDDLVNPELATLLHYYDLVRDETNVAMWLNLRTRPINPASNNPLLIRGIQSPDEYDQFADVIAELFGDSPEADQIRQYYQLISRVHVPTQPMRFYLGEYEGKIVTTGTLFLDDESAGIYDIATRPDWRGHGFGSHMFDYLLGEAHRQSARQVVLQASADGLGIYKRAGFVEVGTVQVYDTVAETLR